LTVTLAHIFRAAAKEAAQHATPGSAADAPGSTVQGKTNPTAAGTVSLQELLHLHGDASTAVVLMLLALFTTLPIAGVGTILSLAIFALAWRWALYRETTTVHGRIGAIRLSPLWTGRTLGFLAWMYEQADQLLSPRLLAMSSRATRPWWALWICMMGAIIFLPIPFGNILPSFSLVALSLAWMFRDGIALLVSLVLGSAALVFSVIFGQLAWLMLVRAGQWLMGIMGMVGA
jgi:hypothetical protein